uniref:Uncharacterized protein n=1 Tax=Trichogramma kaykai TaxID=54128 RepID=A0ABD2WS39_9HYME
MVELLARSSRRGIHILIQSTCRENFPILSFISSLRCAGSFCALVSAKQPTAKVFCVSFCLYELQLIVLWRIARAVCEFIFSCKCEPRNCTQFLQVKFFSLFYIKPCISRLNA